MPLRSRLRRAFTRGSQDDPNLTKKKTKGDPNVYQPGEKMPPLKYKRPVDPAHKAHLEAFAWATAWRRRSDQSLGLYSPMGSRIPSRKSSFQSFGRRSIGGRSIRRRSKSLSRGDDNRGLDSGIGGSVADDDRPEQLREDSDEEGDVTNVGLSRNPTEDPRRPRKSSSFHGRPQSVKSESRPATSDRTHRPSTIVPKNEIPFAPEDLELALKKSNLQAEADRSGETSPESPNKFMHLQVPGIRPRERLVAFDDNGSNWPTSIRAEES